MGISPQKSHVPDEGDVHAPEKQYFWEWEEKDLRWIEKLLCINRRVPLVHNNALRWAMVDCKLALLSTQISLLVWPLLARPVGWLGRLLLSKKHRWWAVSE